MHKTVAKMEKEACIPFVYSTSFPEITSSEFRGWIIHLICLAGGERLCLQQEIPASETV